MQLKPCTACEEELGEAHDGVADATHTFYDPHNTMYWCCDRHAESLLDAVRMSPQEWVGCKLIPTVEESDPERRQRYQRSNLLRFPLKVVAA